VSDPLPKTIDAVVIGAGIIGASMAYHLTEAGLGVLVIEKEQLPGTGSTAAAAGGIRAIFDNELDIRYALETRAAMPTFEERFGWKPEFRRHGYLYTARRESTLDEYRRDADAGIKCGTGARMLTPEEVPEIAPILDMSGIVGAMFGPEDGYCDPYGVMMGFLSAARKNGARISYRTQVTGVKTEGGRVTGVATNRGEVSCATVVNCAGPFARKVAAMVDLDIPARPHRRYIFVTGPFPQVPKTNPLVLDQDNLFYFKPESGTVIMSGMEEEPDEPDDTAVRWERSEGVAEKALRCASVFSEAGFARAWAGMRTLTPDRRAILGPTPVDGFFLACGFSGHGICQCVPAGRVVAEYITKGKSEDLPIEPYFLSRFEEPQEG